MTSHSTGRTMYQCILTHAFCGSCVIQERKCEYHEAHCDCNHFTLISIILICPVCGIYIPFVFIASCVSVYNFRPVEPRIIHHAKSMDTASKTGINLSCCPLVKSRTLLIWWLPLKTLYARVITDVSLMPAIKELSCEDSRNGNV
jgi:hypothetical protein